MQLNAKEVRLIHELRGTPTGRVTVVMYKNEIKNIRVEVDVEIADKAAGKKEPWGGQDEIKIQEGLRRPAGA